MNLDGQFFERNKQPKAAMLLLLLSIVDSLCTDFGIRNHHITEANPLMRVVYDTSVVGFYLIKISFPILFLYLLTKIEPKRILRILTSLTLFLYTFVFFQHMLWISLLLTS